jgi:hydrogenase maturation protease
MRRIVIGLGNPDRGDDAAGRAVARQLRLVLPPEVAVAESDGEATDLLALLDGADAACLIDACTSGAPAGAIRRFDLAAGRLPSAACPVSSHGLGLGDALELARALGRLPPRCLVYAIEAGHFDAGAAMSPAVAQAIGEVARLVRAAIA